MKVTINNLTKKYGEKSALKGVNLNVPDGSFLVILGPSGSGKTTLLRILAGLLYPSEGEIFFNDVNITKKPANKRNVAMVFQNYPLFPHMTVFENLKFPLESQREGKIFKRRIISDEEIQKKVDETLKLLHIEEHSLKYPSQLSGGEQQRTAIGRELIRDPVLFLFDEPLSNIDARLRHEMRSWIRRLHSIIKKTMIYVTHDQSEASSLGDLIVLLNEGEIVQIGTPEELYYNPVNKFAAQFIGNYPMNFLPFKVKKNKIVILEDKEISVPNEISIHTNKLKIKNGEFGFRAESIREYDPKKPKEKNMLCLECTVEYSERILDQQILTLKLDDRRFFFLTKTKKIFKANDQITILIHFENVHIFNEKGNKVSLNT
ncbi:MAG: ABC transporter ATP-binding protein [Candidatus Thorarchaeota archaeon]